MPWARVPCDKLANISLFGYHLEKEDGRNLWYRGPDGELFCVDRYAPRFLFESISEAVQAGATAVKISTANDGAELAEIHKALSNTGENSVD